jgi:hypothetical protein
MKNIIKKSLLVMCAFALVLGMGFNANAKANAMPTSWGSPTVSKITAKLDGGNYIITVEGKNLEGVFSTAPSLAISTDSNPDGHYRVYDKVVSKSETKLVYSIVKSVPDSTIKSGLEYIHMSWYSVEYNYLEVTLP